MWRVRTHSGISPYVDSDEVERPNKLTYAPYNYTGSSHEADWPNRTDLQKPRGARFTPERGTELTRWEPWTQMSQMKQPTSQKTVPMLGTSGKACFYLFIFIGIPARSSKKISAEFLGVVPSNSQELDVVIVRGQFTSAAGRHGGGGRIPCLSLFSVVTRST